MNTLRVFFAILPPASMSKGFSDLLEASAQSLPPDLLRWVNVENLHVTLQFLKNIQPIDLKPLIERVRLELQNTPAFQMEFGGLEWFPTIKNPKILSMVVGPKTKLLQLSTAIGRAITALNYPLESQPFRGHMTLGRVLTHQSQELRLLQKIKVEPRSSMLINELYLIESKLSHEGAIYRPLAKIELGACFK